MMPIQLNPEFARQVRLAEVGRKLQKQAAKKPLLGGLGSKLPGAPRIPQALPAVPKTVPFGDGSSSRTRLIGEQSSPAALAMVREKGILPGPPTPPNVSSGFGAGGTPPTPNIWIHSKPSGLPPGAAVTPPRSIRPAAKPVIPPPGPPGAVVQPTAPAPKPSGPPLPSGDSAPQRITAGTHGMEDWADSLGVKPGQTTVKPSGPAPATSSVPYDGWRGKPLADVDPVTGLPNLKPIGIGAGVGLGAGVGGAGLLAMTRDGKAQAAASPAEATPDATTPAVTPTPAAGPGGQAAAPVAATTPPAAVDSKTGQPVVTPSPAGGTTPGATGLKEGLEAATGKDATPQMAQPVIDFVTSMLPENIGQMLKAFSDKHGANMTVGGVSLGLIGLMLLLQNMFGKSGAAIPWKPRATNYKRVPTGRFMSANGTIPVPKGPGKTILPSPLSSAVKTGLLSIKRK